MYPRLLVSQINEVYCLVTSFGKQSMKQIYDIMFVKNSSKFQDESQNMQRTWLRVREKVLICLR